jgi:DNA-binding PadR family transcriptional regulator
MDTLEVQLEQIIISQLDKLPKTTWQLRQYLPIREFLKKNRMTIEPVLEDMEKKKVIYSDYVKVQDITSSQTYWFLSK